MTDETVAADVAWEALASGLFDVGMTSNARRLVLDRHRPAIEAAIRGREGLDVERLARAMGSTGNCGHSSCPRDTSRHDDEARAIAAEYARLTPADGEDRDRD